MILKHREVDPTELSTKELVQRNRRNRAKLGAVVFWLNDSISWMKAATLMDERSGRRETKGERVNDSHLNVAYVAAGYAYELAIKSIAKADDVLEKPTHSVVQTYANLSEDRQAEIAAAIREHGAGAAEAYFRRVDEMCTHKDRKYWMFEKDMWSAAPVSFEIADGVLAIDGLARIHGSIVEVGRRAVEEWKRIHSMESEQIRHELAGLRGSGYVSESGTGLDGAEDGTNSTR